MAAPERIVIVGAGLAGVRTAERLRELGFDGSITLVGEEAEPPYDRPPLSKQVLRGERELVLLRDPEAYAELAVDLRLGLRAVSLDPDARAIELDDGTRATYDALVVATGSRPRLLPGAVLDGVHVLRTAEDCRRLRASVAAGTRAVVVGGGFIGCEVAASLRLLGLDVTIVELASAPLVGVLGEQLSAHVVRLHEANGVQLRCGVGVDAVEGEGAVTGVRLLDGSLLPADVVVVGLGVSPAVEWLAGSGLSIDNGVSCDAAGRTSAPGVYAVGDVAAWRDPRTGAARRYEHWTSAVDQAAVVARAIVGAATDEPLPVPYFWSDQYKLKIQSLGLPSASADEVTVLELSETKRLALYGSGGLLTGAVGFSSPSAVMKMRPLLSEPTAFATAVERASSG